MTEARAAQGSRAMAAALDHVARLSRRIPTGTRARPVRGGNVLRAMVPGLDLAIRRRWGTREGTAIELLTWLWEAGLVVLAQPPHRITAGPAMARLAELTPLVQVIVRGRYRIHAGDPAFHPDWLSNSILSSLGRDASTPADPVCAGHFDASAPDATADPTSLLMSDPDKERGRGETSSDPSSASDGEAQGLTPGRPGAAAGSSSAPADEGRSRPVTPPARAPLEPLVVTRSGYLALVPLRRQQQRAAALALRYLAGAGMSGTAAIVAARLAQADGGATSRSRASLARAIQALIRRGLLIEVDGWIRLPELAADPVLDMLDVAEMPDPRRASAGLTEWLARQGVSAAGLSHDEAVLVSRRLWTRIQEGKPSAGALIRIARAQAKAELPSDLRRLGRLDWSAARRELSGAMRARMSDAQIWGTDGH